MARTPVSIFLTGSSGARRRLRLDAASASHEAAVDLRRGGETEPRGDNYVRANSSTLSSRAIELSSLSNLHITWRQPGGGTALRHTNVTNGLTNVTLRHTRMPLECVTQFSSQAAGAGPARAGFPGFLITTVRSHTATASLAAAKATTRPALQQMRHARINAGRTMPSPCTTSTHPPQTNHSKPHSMQNAREIALSTIVVVAPHLAHDAFSLRVAVDQSATSSHTNWLAVMQPGMRTNRSVKARIENTSSAMLQHFKSLAIAANSGVRVCGVCGAWVIIIMLPGCTPGCIPGCTTCCAMGCATACAMGCATTGCAKTAWCTTGAAGTAWCATGAAGTAWFPAMGPARSPPVHVPRSAISY